MVVLAGLLLVRRGRNREERRSERDGLEREEEEPEEVQLPVEDYSEPITDAVDAAEFT